MVPVKFRGDIIQVIRKRRTYRFNWRKGNRFTLLVDGERYYPRMLDEISQAKVFIWFEMYLFESGSITSQFIDALGHAVIRGVQVCLLLDGYGSRGLSVTDRQRLDQFGINVCFYNRLRLFKWFDNLARNHRKLLLVDGRIAFVGGAGITDDFAPSTNASAYWRETMMEIYGPVLQDWQVLFCEVWNKSGKPEIHSIAASSAPVAGDMPGRVVVTSGQIRQGIMQAFIRRARKARSRIWLATAYFVPSHRLRRTLRSAAHRGVDVRLLLPGPKTDHPAIRQAGRRYYVSLLRHGVRIFEYQPRVLHGKTAMCDGWVSIGSSNFDRWSLRWNLEANQTVLDEQFAKGVSTMFEKDFKESTEIDLSQWVNRSAYARWVERFWGRVDIWLHRLGQGRRKNI